MNILYLCADRGIPIRGHKGAAVHVRALTNAFVRAGHAVTLLSPRTGPSEGPAVAATLLEVPMLPLTGSIHDPASREQQSHAYVDVLYTAAREQLTSQPYDFIYERYSLWSDVGARLAQATGLPLVLEVNAPLLSEARQYRQLTATEVPTQIEAAQFSNAHVLSVVSDELRDYVVSRGAVPERVQVLPNGVDPEYFHPAVRGGAVRAQWELHHQLIIGFVGRPRPWHDLDTLCAAVEKLRAEDARYHLLLVGEMPVELHAHLAAHYPALAGAVTLTGPVPHEAVSQYMAAMDVAVSPHPDWPDFYFSPLKLYEYMACGVPTIAANVGQPARLIQPGVTGYLYPPGDAEALAAHIRTLVAQPDHARDVAWNGAAHVLTQHTWDGNARAVVNWIKPAPPEPEPDPLVWPRPVALPILDSKLRQRLYRATRPDLAGPLLARGTDVFGKKGERFIRLDSIRVLKYKSGRRCVLAYALRERGGDVQHVIGKVYRDDRAQHLHNLQQVLWANGFGPDATDGIHVPRVLGVAPEMRMLVQEAALGTTLNDLVAGEAEVGALIRRSAEGLAKLHSLRWPAEAEPLGHYFLEHELASLDRFTAELTRYHSASRIEPIREALRTWASQLPVLVSLTPVHRDFYYSQILFDHLRLTLIDFDLLVLGDPAIDVANFIAHLYFLGLDRLGNLTALAEDARVFLDTYTHSHPVDDGFRQRLAFYEAATFFRLMNVVSTRPGLTHLFQPLYRHTRQAIANAALPLAL